MFDISNNLLGILNFLTFLLSVPILVIGIWLRNHGVSGCEQFLQTPLIVLGVFLMLVSLAGLFGACCRVTLLLWLYLVVMFLLILALFCVTIFAFVVTNDEAGKVLSSRGYKEYKLGDYSHWLQKRVGGSKNWNKIRACLVQSKICTHFNRKFGNDTVSMFFTEDLSAIQSGCCKPPDECGYTYVSPSNWTIVSTGSTDTDCIKWANRADTLCFDCNSCRAGVLDTLRRDWKKTAIVNIVVLIFMIIVYSVGCCAFRNSKG